MNVVINNKSNIYKYLPVEIQDKIDSYVNNNIKKYVINNICPIIQETRIRYVIKEIMYNYWIVFKYNLVERMHSNNRFYLNILEGDILHYFNNKNNIFGHLTQDLCLLLENAFDIMIDDYYDFQIKTRQYDKYIRILIILRNLSFEQLEEFYFYCIFMRSNAN